MTRILTLCALLLAAAAPAVGQERAGMPPVQGDLRPNLPDVNPRAFESDPDTGLHQAFADFASWNQSANRPKILLFWNRALSDDTTTRYREREEGSAAATVSRGVAISAYERTREMERTTGGRHADLHPDDDGDLESGYVSAFLRSGANVIDRGALMRKVSTAQGQSDRSDQQFMESLALEQGVDYLVEVLPEYRADTETGMLFTIKITHLPSSQVRAQFRTTAQPALGPERLVAGPGGFRRTREDRNSNGNIAEALAAETMRRFF